MADANSHREHAKRYRELAQQVTDPELLKQLELWALELDLIADTFEHSSLIGEADIAACNYPFKRTVQMKLLKDRINGFQMI